MLTATSKKARTGACVAFAIVATLLALAFYASHKDSVTVQAWTADSSWKGGWE